MLLVVSNEVVWTIVAGIIKIIDYKTIMYTEDSLGNFGNFGKVFMQQLCMFYLKSRKFSFRCIVALL